ncbi:ImmA/IrrE family metallo-endopeptidase [Herbiconiux sp.]|uniref:ImmA/IrrE family metallo-endopeptidase n=1 Tax=Herbiconiux sp. TaxID=1871186 RepID=UPI0025C62398|nr:ImmA/IrrE family metallo-endopeptidase [Herbiconiux sp.]
MRELLGEALRLGIRIHLAHLDEVEEGLLGFYDHDDSAIYVEIGLTRAERHEVIAHELGHAKYCHTCDSEVGERQANAFAASILVNPEVYARAEAISYDLDFIAEELDVTRQVVIDYQRYCLERIGNVTYVKPKMGAGQWIARHAHA